MFYILIHTIFIIILKFLETLYKHKIHISICSFLLSYFVRDAPLHR